MNNKAAFTSGIFASMFFVGALAPRSHATAIEYRITAVNVAPLFVPSEINNAGQLVGFVGAAGGTSYLHDTRSGVTTDLGPLVSTAGDVVALVPRTYP
jgi:hypothetical protein